MGYQVALAPSARRDLRDIVRYISLDSPERALAFGQLLISSTKRLAEFPEMGRVVPEFGDASLREIVVRS
jgi:toxin ParE1/3/4